MVLLIAFLLLTASVALLSGVSAGTRNGTDMLSETKAFYAAESGLQATINALRHRDPKVKYSEADANPSMDAYITYNYPLGAPNRVVIGQPAGTYDPASGEAYSLIVGDPDDFGDGLTFNTSNVQTRFTSYTGTGGGVITTSSGVSTATITDSAVSPPTEMTITMTAKANTPVNFIDGDTTNDVNPLVDFGFTNTGATMPAGDEIRFQIIYTLSAPRIDAPKKTIYGKITSVSGTPTVTLDSPTAELVGSSITLCSTNVVNCTFSPMALNQALLPLFVRMSPVEPVRLRVSSTGYGPNGAKKVLEAIIRKDIPNLSASPAATSMIGPNTCPTGYPSCLGFSFLPGTSSGITYSGCPTDGSGCVPSFGLTDPTNLNLVSTARRPNGDPISASPPPEMITDTLPEWQQSVAALEAFVDNVRVQAQGSDRYFSSSNGTTPVSLPNNPGDFNTGTGITFCEGSCTVGGSGGGILVVTGQLTNTGNFSFKGLIVVVGEEGWLRNGGGNGQIIGSVVIAPYNMRNYIPANHATTFLPPRYLITGGGNSDVIYGDVSGAFGNTSGVSDLVQAIAER